MTRSAGRLNVAMIATLIRRVSMIWSSWRRVTLHSRRLMMKYEDDKELRRLRKKLNVLADLWWHSDPPRQDEIRAEMRLAEHDISRIYEAQWKPGFVKQGANNGNRG